MNPFLTRRQSVQWLAAGLLASTASLPALAAPAPLRQGKIFLSTNAPTGNELLVFESSDDGPPGLLARVPTQGLGTGGGLGSQGAVTLSSNGRYLFVVNAQSNSVTTFSLTGPQPALTSVVASGGLTPTSVTEFEGIVYVLNASGDGNVTGFRNIMGVLTPIADSTRGLSAAGGTAPAQVGFSRGGDALVVAERATNRLLSFPVRANGRLGTATVTPSAGVTPFGFAFTRHDKLIVSEAAGGAAGASSVSSYRFGWQTPSAPLVVSAAVPTTQTAACWIAVTPNGRFAFSANAGSSSVSSFGIGRGGTLTLLAAAAGLTGPNGGAIDMAVSADGQQLHVLAPRGQQIVSYEIGRNGSLKPLGVVAGLPAGTAGMAAN